MKTSAIHEPYPPVDMAALACFEEKLGCELPNDYREFLMSINGGAVHHPYVDPETGVRPTLFLGLVPPARGADLRRTYEDSRDWIPKGLVPIANDSFGNHVCIQVEGTHIGELYFCDHEVDMLEDKIPDPELIAGRFIDFLSKLAIEDEPPDVQLVGAESDVVEAFQAIHDDNALLLTQPLARGLSPNTMDQAEDATSLLHYAAFGCRLECIDVLLEFGADINLANSRGTTPLFMAVYGNCRRCVRQLVERGAQINVANANGRRPLYEAIQSQSLLVAKELTELGANTSDPLPDGRSVVQLVRDSYANSYYKRDGEELIKVLMASQM